MPSINNDDDNDNDKVNTIRHGNNKGGKHEKVWICLGPRLLRGKRLVGEDADYDEDDDNDNHDINTSKHHGDDKEGKHEKEKDDNTL